jgi:hypothetical protein
MIGILRRIDGLPQSPYFSGTILALQMFGKRSCNPTKATLNWCR